MTQLTVVLGLLITLTSIQASEIVVEESPPVLDNHRVGKQTAVKDIQTLSTGNQPNKDRGEVLLVAGEPEAQIIRPRRQAFGGRGNRGQGRRNRGRGRFNRGRGRPNSGPWSRRRFGANGGQQGRPRPGGFGFFRGLGRTENSE